MAVIVNGAGLVSDFIMPVEGHSALVFQLDGRAEPLERIVLLCGEGVGLAVLPA